MGRGNRGFNIRKRSALCLDSSTFRLASSGQEQGDERRRLQETMSHLDSLSHLKHCYL